MGRCKPKEFDDLFKLKKLKGYGVYDLTEVKFTVDFYPQAVGFRSTLEEVPEWVKLKCIGQGFPPKPEITGSGL